jgi:hypothetical protein
MKNDRNRIDGSTPSTERRERKLNTKAAGALLEATLESSSTLENLLQR